MANGPVHGTFKDGKTGWLMPGGFVVFDDANAKAPEEEPEPDFLKKKADHPPPPEPTGPDFSRPLKNTGPDLAGQMKTARDELSGRPPAPTSEDDPTASIPSRIGTALANTAKSFVNAVPTAIDLVSPISKDGGLQVPFSQLMNPAYRHELERGVADTVTFGLGSKAAAAVDNAAESSGLGALSSGFGSKAQQESEEAPEARNLGGIAGGMLPNPIDIVAPVGKAIASRVGETALVKPIVTAVKEAAAPIAGKLREAGESIVEGAKGRNIDRLVDDLGSGATKPMRDAIKKSKGEVASLVEREPKLAELAGKPDELIKEADRITEDRLRTWEKTYGDADYKSSRKATPLRDDSIPVADNDIVGSEPVNKAHAIAEADAIKAEIAAKKARDKLAKADRAGEPVNPELRARVTQRKASLEVAATELEDNAKRLRAEADTIRGKTPPKATASIKDPAVSVERKGGIRLGDVFDNIDKSMRTATTTAEQDMADDLLKIRSKLVRLHGDDPEAIIPSSQFRREASVQQQNGYARADGPVENSAKEAAKQASKDINDVITKHVTGMGYADAKRVAAVAPSSDAGKLFQLNNDLKSLAKIKKAAEYRADSTSPGTPGRLKKMIHGATDLGAMAVAAGTHSKLPLLIPALSHGIPMAARAIDKRIAPIAARGAVLPVGAARESSGILARIVGAQLRGDQLALAQERERAKQAGLDDQTIDGVLAQAQAANQ